MRPSLASLLAGRRTATRRAFASSASAVASEMADDEIFYDVMVRVNKATDGTGYGIYFTHANGIIKTTKLDKGSEAERAGVQAGDELAYVKDMDGKLPEDAPGKKVEVTVDNYQQTLQLVRNMKFCEMGFRSPGFN